MRSAYTTHAARFTGSRELLSEGVHILFWWTAALAAAALIARAVPDSPGWEQSNPLKQCAAALVTLEMAAECTQFNAVNNSCVFTMADLQAVREAGAAKQTYCPVLEAGEESAND